MLLESHIMGGGIDYEYGIHRIQEYIILDFVHHDYFVS